MNSAEPQADTRSTASTTFSQMLLFRPSQFKEPVAPHLYKKSQLDFFTPNAETPHHRTLSEASTPVAAKPAHDNNGSRYEQLHRQYACTKQAYLRQLLTTTTAAQKQSLLQIQKCIKFLYKRARLDVRQLKRVYMVFVKDYYQLTGKIMNQVELKHFEDTFGKYVPLEPELDA